MAKNLLSLYKDFTTKVKKPAAPTRSGESAAKDVIIKSNDLVGILKVIDESMGGVVSSVTFSSLGGASEAVMHGASILFKQHQHSIKSIKIEGSTPPSYRSWSDRDTHFVVPLVKLVVESGINLTSFKVVNTSALGECMPLLMECDTSRIKYLDFSGCSISVHSTDQVKKFIFSCPSLKYVNFLETSGLERVAHDVALFNPSVGVNLEATTAESHLSDIVELRTREYIRKLDECLTPIKIVGIPEIVLSFMGYISNEFLLSKIDLTPNRDLTGNVTSLALSSFDAAVTAELAGDIAVVVDH